MRKLSLLLFCSVAGSLFAANSYLVHNLVSDVAGMADHVDPNLVNPWGNGFGPTSPFWIGNNGTGTSTLYDGTGTALPLVVKIPSGGASTTPGKVTGVVFNGTKNSFLISGQPPFFIFCTEDGTISGWNPTVDKNNAKIMIDRSAKGESFKGCAIGGTDTAPLLFAANYKDDKIEVWDSHLEDVVSGFTNSAIPSGFAPFNIQNLGGTMYVTYAPQPSPSVVSGGSPYAVTGGGFVSWYTMSGALIGSVAGQTSLNYPWGLAMAPATFGDFANMLLVGNFGDGMIHAFDPTSGALKGTLNDTTGNPITLSGLWSLNFGNGTVSDKASLYFTAGIQNETHGLFGSIQAAPSFVVAGLQNAASSDATTAIAPNSFVSIFGGGLSATTRGWTGSDFVNGTLPTSLNGVSVTINGEPAFINFVSPAQINILVPPDVPAGPVQIQVTNNGLASATVAATVADVAPAFFQFGPPNAAGNRYIAATHADNTPGGPPNFVTGVTSTPFKEGEIIVLYGNGFGVTNPPVTKGQLVTKAAPLATTPTVTIGGHAAEVQFAGLSATGLYQFNVVVPSGLTPGTAANIDVPVVIDLGGGAKTQPTAVISVVNPTT
jgi:uncharacterized protein (TIGR03118 family)